MHPRAARLAERAGDERGATLVLWALMVVAVFTMVAIVIDLGELRDAKREAQSVADFATLVGARTLAEPTASAATACQDAWTYIKANTPDLPASASMPCSGLVDCDPLNAQEDSALATGTGPYTIEIIHGVLPSTITDPRTGGAHSNDGNTCERFLVRVQRTNPSFFAGVIGVQSQTIEARAVGRAFGDQTSEQVAALLLLERTDCGVITTSGQGNIFVKQFLNSPGIIHADSKGTTNCGSQSPYIVQGKPVPQGPNAGWPSIMAQGPNAVCPGTGTPGIGSGILDLVGSPGPTDAFPIPPQVGVCPAPVNGKITSRAIVDSRYNAGPNATWVNDLKASSDALLAKSNAQLEAETFFLYTDCAGTGTVTQPKVIVDCTGSALSPGSQNGGQLVFNADTVVVRGRIDVGSNRTLSFPNAKDVVVQGCAGVCTGSSSNQVGINVQGTFTVNDGGTTCANRTTANGVTPARLTLRGGPIQSTGSQSVVRMCQTFVLMSGQTSPQAIPGQGTGGDLTCTVAAPCPLSNNFTGYVRIHNQTVDWTAPNQLTEPANEQNKFEDLALWTEAGSSTLFANDSEIGGSGATITSGVFFMPNARFTFSGNTQINQDFDAQFVARKLDMSGQGTLSMKPNPANSVPQFFPVFSMIR